MPAAWSVYTTSAPASRRALPRSSAATTTAQHDSEHRQSTQSQAAIAGRRRAEGALGRVLRASTVVGRGHDRVRGDVDIEGEFAGELVGAILQVAGADELPSQNNAPPLSLQVVLQVFTVSV